jgi:hypothetical protein
VGRVKDDSRDLLQIFSHMVSTHGKVIGKIVFSWIHPISFSFTQCNYEMNGAENNCPHIHNWQRCIGFGIDGEYPLKSDGRAKTRSRC